MKELKDYPVRTKDEIYNGFKKIKYRYLGIFYWSYKTVNAWDFDNVEEFVVNNLQPIEKKIFGEPRTFITEELNIDFKRSKYFDVYLDYDNTNKKNLIDKYGEQMTINIIKKRTRMLSQYLSNVGQEGIFQIKEGGYCFYNMKEKYYYNVAFNNLRGNLQEVFEFYRCLKAVPNYLSIYEQQCIETLKKEQDAEVKRQQWLKIKEVRTKQFEELKKIKDSIKEDCEKNPENYKYVPFKDLPKNVQDDIKADNTDNSRNSYGGPVYDEDIDFNKILNGTYFVYSTSYTYYESEGRGPEAFQTDYYINNRELTDGYMYSSSYRMSNWTGD